MSALSRLAKLLHDTNSDVAKPIPADDNIDAVILQLKKNVSRGASAYVPEDLQQRAVEHFWESRRLESFKDARLVSFGMCVPHRGTGSCIMEDRGRFRAVLDQQNGVDQWLNEPRWYRRCYQGLVRSYFTYDAKINSAPLVGRQNWGDLRDYLLERSHHIVDKSVNPEWVSTVVENLQLFSDKPCDSYAEALLNGDASAIDLLCEQLGIVKASWFLRELILAQVRQATKLNHDKFARIIPQLLELLAGNMILRDKGLILILDRYAAIPEQILNPPLRDAAVAWWGNPWLPSNETRWGGVIPSAREMVSVWLKSEFIEAFFAKLAQDGVGDRRRANFWLRYAKSMDNVQFALGTTAMYSRDKDFVELRKKMKGLITELKTTDSANNAFVMTMGNLVAVEFGGMGNAFYGYDKRRVLPFDLSHPVATTKNADNSLKHDQRLLWMQHQDRIKGWNRWEEMFEATLQKHFNISPATIKNPTRSRIKPPASVESTATASKPPIIAGAMFDVSTVLAGPYSRFSLTVLEHEKNLKVEDFTNKNGNIWVRTDDSDTEVNKVLLKWGFTYKTGKGWWK